MNSNKRELFLSLAEKRTNAVLEKIRILSNCANPYAYEYYDEDIRRMFSAIERELRVGKARFGQKKPRKRFRLSELDRDRQIPGQ